MRAALLRLYSIQRSETVWSYDSLLFLVSVEVLTRAWYQMLDLPTLS
jgi:hypothetical protein